MLNNNTKNKIKTMEDASKCIKRNTEKSIFFFGDIKWTHYSFSFTAKSNEQNTHNQTLIYNKLATGIGKCCKFLLL